MTELEQVFVPLRDSYSSELAQLRAEITEDDAAYATATVVADTLSKAFRILKAALISITDRPVGYTVQEHSKRNNFLPRYEALAGPLKQELDYSMRKSQNAETDKTMKQNECLNKRQRIADLELAIEQCNGLMSPAAEVEQAA